MVEQAVGVGERDRDAHGVTIAGADGVAGPPPPPQAARAFAPAVRYHGGS
jgi:hypothetical protein